MYQKFIINQDGVLKFGRVGRAMSLWRWSVED